MATPPKYSSIFLIALLLCNIFISCEPPRVYLTTLVKLKATISNTNETIRLGDTLRIRLFLPDTITTENNEKIAINSVQNAQFSANISKLDTVTKYPIFLAPPDYFVTEGSINNNRTFQLTTAVKPFAVTLHIVPKEKGIYNIEVNPQPENFKINGNGQPIGLITGFDVLNSHFMLINPFFPEIVADSARTKQAGYGYYWVRVN